MLSRVEQNGILQRGWPVLFALRASIWPLDIGVLQSSTPISGKMALKSLARARATLMEVRPDHLELSILETFALCRPELAETNEGQIIMTKARDAAADILIRHLETRNDHAGQRLARIMLILPTLSACCSCDFASTLFAAIIGDAAVLDQVIASIQ
ncbi:uncharacterized protein LOC125499940 [Athalia rosae]|uniref:uncharacterized protein LOC125499940 n=1 Tax=Athalia rosae TaxID=37344 RepID=UPI002033909D|nr:uncharacterized protein LOC125499940 [Athalia rosae]